MPPVRAGGALPIRRHLKSLAALLAVLALVGAVGIAVGIAPRQNSMERWVVKRPLDARRTGRFEHPMLTESSGVAVSRRQPGILWTLNDSGNDAWIFATDTMGRDHGAFLVAGAENRDWEAIALGPCRKGDCLYIADTGDNGRSHKTARLYRVPEPSITSPMPRTRTAEVLEFRYPRGAPDVESMYVSRDGTVTLITKTQSAPARVYRLGADAWANSGIAVAEAIGTLPVDYRSFANEITDAALSPSGRVVAVRTYRAIYLFGRTPDDKLASLGVACDTAGLQLQGEGVGWLNDQELVLTSEGGLGGSGTVVVLRCEPNGTPG